MLRIIWGLCIFLHRRKSDLSNGRGPWLDWLNSSAGCRPGALHDILSHITHAGRKAESWKAGGSKCADADRPAQALRIGEGRTSQYD